MDKMKTFLFAACLFALQIPCMGQFRIGAVLGTDLYHWYRNPTTTPDSAGRSVGNALVNISLGPKIWIGGERFSFSVEGQVSFGLLDLNVGHYNGLGSLAFPLLARFNFNGLSGFCQEEKTGWTIGGGIQYTKAPLIAIPTRYKDAFAFYPTYIGEIGFGATNGERPNAFLYLRGGFSPKASTVAALGVQVGL